MENDLPGGLEVLRTIGYEFAAYDGGLNPFDYWDKVPVPGVHCPLCYSPVNHEAVSDRVRVRGKADVHWADGHLIVTERFRDFCLAKGYDDLEFPCVNKRRELFELRPTRIVDVDFERSEPLLGEYCIRCGNFGCYLVGRALFLRDVAEPLDDGFYRTDLYFGCGSGKHPTFVVGIDTMKAIKAEGFSNLFFEPIPTLNANFETRRKRSLEADIRALRKLRGDRSWRKKDGI